MLTSFEAMFENLWEAAPIAMLGVDQSGAIRFVNRLTELLFGYDRDELIGQPVEVLMPESFRSVDAAHRANYVSPAGQSWPMGVSLALTGRRHDGSEFPVDISLSSIETPDGRMVVAAARDVTDRTKENQHLRRLAKLIEYSDDAMIGKTLGGIITSWNPAAEKMFGYSSEEVVGKAISLMPDDRPEELSFLHDRLREGKSTEHLETTRIRKDGKVIPVDITVSAILNADGIAVAASTIARDVTKQMAAIDNACTSSLVAFYAARSMIESSLDSLVSISPEGMITDVNAATIKVTGVARAELIGTAFSDYFTESEKANKIYQLVFAEGMAVDYPLTMRHKDGTLTEVLYNASVYRDAKGTVLGVFAAARDVTKQMQAFDAARGMIESSLDSLVSISPEGMITDLNEATIKVTGVPRWELVGTAFSDYFTEPDKANEIYQRVFAEGMAVDYPLTMRHKDGTLTEVLYNASVYRDSRGNVLGVFAAARDVTKQMQAQAEIADQRSQELQRLVELEQFQRLTVGRELKMIELKKQLETFRSHEPADGSWSEDSH